MSRDWPLTRITFPPVPFVGSTRNEDDLKELALLNDKFSVAIADLYQQKVAQQIHESPTANQIRGSFNRPEVIQGVDTEEEAAATGMIQDNEAFTMPTGRAATSTTGRRYRPF
jgi:hypothetical protein